MQDKYEKKKVSAFLCMACRSGVRCACKLSVQTWASVSLWSTVSVIPLFKNGGPLSIHTVSSTNSSVKLKGRVKLAALLPSLYCGFVSSVQYELWDVDSCFYVFRAAIRRSQYDFFSELPLYTEDTLKKTCCSENISLHFRGHYTVK